MDAVRLVGAAAIVTLVIAIAAVVIAWRNWQRYGTGAT